MVSRNFSSVDAEKLINTHKDLNRRMTEVIVLGDNLANQVVDSARNYGTIEAYDFLKTLSVEELKTQKHGLPIKKLKDAGYENLSQLMPVSVKQLEAINGIGFETAFVIKNFVNTYAENIKKNVKISLSADKRTRGSNEVVQAIDRYLRIHDVSEKTKALYYKVLPDIGKSINDLALGTTNLKWLFSSDRNKQLAVNAYNYLSSLIYGEYGQVVNTLFQHVDNIMHQSDDVAWNNFMADPILYNNTLEKFAPDLVGVTDEKTFGLPEDLAQAISQQNYVLGGLKCTLRRYQEWGVKYILHQERVLLGDEMGLGKTVQAIASMVALRNAGATHFMVICPASVIINWVREIEKHSDLQVFKVHGNERYEAMDKWDQKGGVAVTNYETTQHLQLPDGFKYCMAVVDEAHYIKNPTTIRSQNVKRLCDYAERILFMTGTALENKVEEMVTLIRMLQPDIAETVKDMTYMSKASLFREIVAPVYYRRKREDVLSELPELIEVNAWCHMTEPEIRAYHGSLFQRNFTNVRRVSWNVENINDSSKAKRLLEIVKEAELDKRKVIVFSFFLDTIQKVQELLGDHCVSAITGSVSPDRRQEIVDEFDISPAGTVLPAQIVSGGTGLNIQSASVVIICEPQFKPSIENQAIARAYRMGQARNVMVYRLLCEDTVDEKLIQVLAEKQAIFDSFADDSVAADRTEDLEIDDTGFNNIIEDEIKRITLTKDNV